MKPGRTSFTRNDPALGAMQRNVPLDQSKKTLTANLNTELNIYFFDIFIKKVKNNHFYTLSGLLCSCKANSKTGTRAKCGT